MSDAIDDSGLLSRFFHRNTRADRDPDVELLRQVALFDQLSIRELRRLAAIVHKRQYETDEYMFEQGQPGAAMFVVKSGQLSITVPGAVTDIQVASLEAGAFVGELALLDDSPRSASARATQPTQALAFFREDLHNLLDTAPRLSSKIYQALALLIGQRLKAMNRQLSKNDEDSAITAEPGEVTL